MHLKSAVLTRRLVVLAAVLAIAPLVAVRPSPAAAQTAKTLATDQPQYEPGDQVTITGRGFGSGQILAVPVVLPDRKTMVATTSAATCSATSPTDCWDKVTADAGGTFTYRYPLGLAMGTYDARVYNSGWNGNLAATPQAQASFDNGRVDFRQCLNDSNDDSVKDDCDWSTGASNANNSAYVEGDTVGQRLLLRFDNAGSHVVELQYDFTKNDLYGYDFLGRVDTTQSGALLNECTSPPSFLDAPTCGTLFSGAASVPIPADPFDSVALRETAGRVMLIGGSSAAPNISIVGHTPAAVCVGNCGTSAVTVQITVTTAAANAPVAIWFGSHLALSTPSPTGWGAGQGASSITGAPFHVALGHGGRSNQINLGEQPAPVVPEAPFPIILLLSAGIIPGLLVLNNRRRRTAGPNLG